MLQPRDFKNLEVLLVGNGICGLFDIPVSGRMDMASAYPFPPWFSVNFLLCFQLRIWGLQLVYNLPEQWWPTLGHFDLEALFMQGDEGERGGTRGNTIPQLFSPGEHCSS
jgi:hypothetical protein